MNYFIFIPVATLVLSLFFGAHYGVYLFVTRFFDLSTSAKTILAIVLVILSVSFFASSAVSHWADGLFSRAWYFVSGVWMGTLINLLLAMAATYIVLGLARLLAIDLSGPALAGAFLVLAFIVSAYGVWNAMHPRIKNISVTVPNLPDEWRGKKIVQISDVHLGHVYQESFLRKVVEQINAEDPKIVVITGDLFDGMDGKLESFVGPLDDIRAENGVLFVNGNHETYLGTQKALDILQQTRVRILRDEVIDEDGLAFIGLRYPERGETKNIVETLGSLRPEFSGKPSVLLYHAPVMINQIAKAGGVNLQLAGHTHQGQQFPFQFVTHLVHKGYDYGLHQIGDYALYTSSGVGTWGPTMRAGTQSEIVVITLE